jgi:hypothetical protein
MESSSSTNFVGENCHVMGVGQSLGSSPNHIGDETRMEDDEFRRGWRTPRGTWGTPPFDDGMIPFGDSSKKR